MSDFVNIPILTQGELVIGAVFFPKTGYQTTVFSWFCGNSVMRWSVLNHSKITLNKFIINKEYCSYFNKLPMTISIMP